MKTSTNIYYKQKQMIARVDRQGNILGEIERWEAHEKGILHKAFTVAIYYKDKLIVQHRKHPVFDSTFDITSSSHQLYDKGHLQDTIEATFITLKREWNVDKKDILEQPKNLGPIYYKARDKYSIYTEHELCDVVVCTVKKLPTPNLDLAYGYSLASREELRQNNSRLYQNFAPWVKVMIKQNLL